MTIECRCFLFIRIMCNHKYHKYFVQNLTPVLKGPMWFWGNLNYVVFHELVLFCTQTVLPLATKRPVKMSLLSHYNVTCFCCNNLLVTALLWQEVKLSSSNLWVKCSYPSVSCIRRIDYKQSSNSKIFSETNSSPSWYWTLLSAY